MVIAGRCFNLCGPNSKQTGYVYQAATPSDGSQLARFCRSNEKMINRPSMRFAESCFSVQGMRYGSNMMVANSRFASVGKVAGPTVETPQKITECMKLEVFDLERAEEELRASQSARPSLQRRNLCFSRLVDFELENDSGADMENQQSRPTGGTTPLQKKQLINIAGFSDIPSAYLFGSQI